MTPPLVAAVYVAALTTPIILGAANKSGSQLPVLGPGEFKYEAHHDWGELPAAIKYGNTHGVCEDSQSNIYIHHTVNATSESHDTMVVFDIRVSSSGPGARSSKAALTGSTSTRKAAGILYLCDTKKASSPSARSKGKRSRPGIPRMPRPTASRSGRQAQVQPDQPGHRAQWQHLCRRRLRLQLINQYNPKGEYILTFGGTGQRGRPVRARTASPWTCARTRRSSRLPTVATPHPALHARRQAHRFHQRHEYALPFQLL